MKKLAYGLSLCLMLFISGLCFAGCSNSGDIQSIRISVEPTKTEYTVGDTLDITGGKFIIKFLNGIEEEHTMSNMNDFLAYIDYGDNTTTNKFTKATTNGAKTQTIVIRYKQKTTTYNVSVIKGNMDFINYETSYSNTYTGEPLPVTEINATSLGLINGATLESIEYKLASASDSTYTTTAPTNAGSYMVRCIVNGGNNYTNTTFTVPYTITKANLEKFTPTGQLTFANINMPYGTDFDLNSNFKTASNAQTESISTILGEFANLKDNLTYSYRIKNAASDFVTLNELNPIPSLPAGEYDIKVSGTWSNNINPFTRTATLTITEKELTYGTDFVLKITKDGNPVEYIPTGDNGEINTILSYTNSSDINISVQVEFSTEVQAQLISSSVSFTSGSSWETNLNTISTFGDYKIVINAIFNEGTYTVHQTNETEFKAIRVTETN